jgi:hypothetical protein
MPLNNIELVMPDPVTYDIRINELQRDLLQKCLHHTLMTLPKDMWRSADEREVAMGLRGMLDPNSMTGPLHPQGINSFVL